MRRKKPEASWQSVIGPVELSLWERALIRGQVWWWGSQTFLWSALHHEPSASKSSAAPYRPVSFGLILSAYWWQTLLVLLAAAGLFQGTKLLYTSIFRDLPSPDVLTTVPPYLTSKITDRHGTVLYRLYDNENRTLVPLSAIPTHLIEATIAIEDQDFYFHHGFSIRGIARAIEHNWRGEQLEGGSTLTQQLVKTRLLTPERTWYRKMREVLLAIMVEARYSKDQILEMYFNQIAYGGSAYGAEEAAQRYFGKSVRELTLAESALLAGLPAAPSAYSPFGPAPERAEARQREVLRRMVEEGFINQTEADAAAEETLTFHSDATQILAPHFVFYVRQLLGSQYGDEELERGGLVIRTTLDLPTQQIAQTTVSQEITTLKRLRINNGAALVTNPQTGEILAMVGSHDYFDTANDGQVNVTIRPRQPGSSIKPLTYALALEKGMTPASRILDSAVTYQIPGSPPYSPKNYDGQYHGLVTLRQALANSYNVPAVKTLASVGVSNMLRRAPDFGITTWQDTNRFGLSLTLGGGEVKMVEMAQLYGTFASGGYSVPLNPILEITNYKGEKIYQHPCINAATGAMDTPCADKRALSSQVAYLITHILSDNQARSRAFGLLSALSIPNQQVAVKTGTTNSLRDNWTIGYTTDRLVATWVGNNDNTPMSYVASGVTGASPIWNKIMRKLLDESAPHRFASPSGIVSVPYCVTTGTRSCSGCPQVIQEVFVAGTEPLVSCSGQWPVNNPAASDQPTTPAPPRLRQGDIL